MPSAAPALTITPGPYHDGQLINVSVGPNNYFTPYARINILECADPGGKTKNLPTNVTACDGNTIQGTTILVQPNGSFSEHGYQLFALPNASQLGETAGRAARVQPEEGLRALHRAEPGEVHCSQDVLPPVHDLEVEQAFMNAVDVHARSIRGDRLRRGSLCHLGRGRVVAGRSVPAPPLRH